MLPLALVPAGCDVGGASTSTRSCSKITAPAPGDGPPVAVLRDVAGGPVEYLLGVPGGALTHVPEATGQVPPLKTGDRLWFTVPTNGEGGLEVRTARVGECSTRVADGTLGPVDPRGNAAVVGSGARWRIFDASGRSVADLEGIRGTWTPDGLLVEPKTAGGVTVYDEGGHHHDLDLPAGAITDGGFGPGHELLSTDAGLLSMDVQTGSTTPVPHDPTRPTNLAASPDARYLSYFDQNRDAQVMRVADGVTSPLPSPGPATGMTWSADGQWIAVQSPYGGAVVRVSDMKSIDTEALIVISW